MVDKPKGWTSFDVVAKVRGLLKQGGVAKPKVGHTGTLDPLATGLLVLTLGSYCKRAGEFSKLNKTYEITMHLGQTSSTGDEEGEKTDVSGRQPTIEELKSTLNRFVGQIQQTPPTFSAIKVDGQRAYKLARAGKAVQLESRPVTVYSLELIKYDYPLVQCVAKVSSGTYIRSLAEDIGKKLQTGAYLTDLKRTEVGNFNIKDAAIIKSLSPETIYRRLVTP